MEVRLKRRREQLQLSQQALATRVGISRQALSAIESGRQNPSVTTALALASALQCQVEDLFALDQGAAIDAELVRAPVRPPGPWPQVTHRVAIGEVAGRWVAHRLDGTDYNPADGVLPPATDHATHRDADDRRARVRAFASPEQLAGNALVAGCAPLLSTLDRAVGERFTTVRMRWIQASSERALQLLAAGTVHIAGIHLAGIHLIDQRAGDDNAAAVRARFGQQGALMVNLIAWRQGLVVARGNPLGLSATDLARPGLRVAWREPGASAHALLARTLARAGLSDNRPEAHQLGEILAGGHVEVARAIAAGAADVGVAIEAAAVAFGLDFIPLSEERFDLVVAAPDDAVETPVRRILDVVDSPAFRVRAGAFAGYSTAYTGQATRVSGPPEGVSA